MDRVRVGVVGAGSFGRNHLRILSELPGVQLVAVVDADSGRAAEAAAKFGCAALRDARGLAGKIDAAVVAAPTSAHAEVGCLLLDSGVDVLIEKPIAPDVASAERVLRYAEGRILQVGHLERFNPAVRALRKAVTLPLFFEVHRMSMFSARSLDVDVVLDLMIHDVDILLSLTGAKPAEIRAAGIRILSEKVDIANVRLGFANGCIANLTASRVSTEKIRKLRVFQPNQYLSLDYHRQDVACFTVGDDGAGGISMSLPDGQNRSLSFENLPVEKAEPLKLELEAFVDCVRTRREPEVTGRQATDALGVCLDILDNIEEHGRLVSETLQGHRATAGPSVTS